eukprot:m.27979 g.27979  ORF g.27979 m.27979 type:complete len:65 (+) comp6494_c0_seq1:7720-7914(+)
MECRDCSTSTTVSDESFPCSVLSPLPIGGLLPPPSSVDISSVLPKILDKHTTAMAPLLFYHPVV